MCTFKPRQTGFTLIELTMVIVITGILSAMVSVFIQPPIQQYLAISRRAELTDIADTALRRIGRDIRTAVPNSIRLPSAAGASTIEFIPSKAGGNYLPDTVQGSGGCGGMADDYLSFTEADSCFEIWGPAMVFASNDHIIVGSTDATGNAPYQAPNNPGSIRRLYKGTVGSAVTKVEINKTTALPSPSPKQVFFIVSDAVQAVTYACENAGLNNGEGTGVLRRYWAYGFNPSQIIPPVGGQSALLASKVSFCTFTYAAIEQRNGLLALNLEITADNETVKLYHESHVLNVP